MAEGQHDVVVVGAVTSQKEGHVTCYRTVFFPFGPAMS